MTAAEAGVTSRSRSRGQAANDDAHALGPDDGNRSLGSDEFAFNVGKGMIAPMGFGPELVAALPLSSDQFHWIELARLAHEPQPTSIFKTCTLTPIP